MFREVFYAQAGGNESLNIIRWMFRIRLKHFSLVFFACHLVLTLTLNILSIWDDLSLDDDDFAFELTLSLSMFLLLRAIIHFFFVFFSASLCRQVKSEPPAWENGFLSAVLLYELYSLE
jgi:hypothetical protein